MKKWLFFLFFTPLSMYSQTTVSDKKIDPRIIEAYGKEYAESTWRDAPEIYLRWEFYLDNAFAIVDTESFKPTDEITAEIELTDLSNINILKLEQEMPILQKDYYNVKIYHIKGTDRYLAYNAGKFFAEQANEYIKKQLSRK